MQDMARWNDFKPSRLFRVLRLVLRTQRRLLLLVEAFKPLGFGGDVWMHRFYPNGVKAFSPGLRGTSYPGNTSRKIINPNGVVATGVHGDDATPLGL